VIPIVVHTRRFPSRQFHAITLFPFVFYNGERLSEQDLRHESVHIWQQVSLLLIPFYLLYGLFWLYGLLRWRNGHKAYWEIPFERSAYRLEHHKGLSHSTMAFDWMRCIFDKNI